MYSSTGTSGLFSSARWYPNSARFFTASQLRCRLLHPADQRQQRLPAGPVPGTVRYRPACLHPGGRRSGRPLQQSEDHVYLRLYQGRNHHPCHGFDAALPVRQRPYRDPVCAGHPGQHHQRHLHPRRRCHAAPALYWPASCTPPCRSTRSSSWSAPASWLPASPKP